MAEAPRWRKIETKRFMIEFPCQALKRRGSPMQANALNLDRGRSCTGQLQPAHQSHEVVTAPAMTKDEGKGNGLRIPLNRNIARFSEQPHEVVRHIQFFDQHFEN
jgi:hypothetical protein